MNRICAVALTILLLALPATANADRVESYTYLAAGGDVGTVCDENTGTKFGGACSTVTGGDSTATIRIMDSTFGAVGGIYSFRDANQAVLQTGPFCGGTTVPVPPGAVRLYVGVTQALSTLDCGFASAGTVGTITLHYW